MANIYVRSTDGDNADNGSTWALAKATTGGAGSLASAGDTVYVSHVHAESNAATSGFSGVGTLAAPIKLLCVNDGAAPPTALATTGSVSTTGGNNIVISGYTYVYGLIFNVGSGANTAVFYNGTDILLTLEKCQIILVATGSSSRIRFGATVTSNNSVSRIRWKDVDVKFAHVGQGISPVGGGQLDWEGGSVLSGTSPDVLFPSTGSLDVSVSVNVSGVNLSSLASTVNLCGAGANRKVTFRNCKLPASWSGALVSDAVSFGPSDYVAMYNCDSGDTNYKLWIESAMGSVRDETTVVRTGGASDGTTAISWKMASSANAEYPHQFLISPEVVRWNETTASAVTVAVEIVHDSQGAGTGADLQNDEIWLEVQYLGTSGFPLGSFISSAKADIFASAADYTNSSETWTTSGLTSPVKQRMSVTFTPQEKGSIIARVMLAKASKTVYLCQKLIVS